MTDCWRDVCRFQKVTNATGKNKSSMPVTAAHWHIQQSVQTHIHTIYTTHISVIQVLPVIVGLLLLGKLLTNWNSSYAAMKPKLKVALMISNSYQTSLCLSRKNSCFTHNHIFSTGLKKKKMTSLWQEEMGAWMYCTVCHVSFSNLSWRLLSLVCLSVTHVPVMVRHLLGAK